MLGTQARAAIARFRAIADPYLKDVDAAEYADIEAAAVKRARWT